jgi:hypothetical protein
MRYLHRGAHHEAARVPFEAGAVVAPCETHDADTVLSGQQVPEEIAAEFKKA